MSPQFGAITLTATIGPAMRALFLDEQPPDTHSVTITGRRPIPLRTGRRGTRSRAEHARALYIARARRRIARRTGRPAATTWYSIHIPHAVAEAEVLP